MLSIAAFTLSSALCGLSTSLSQLILFRVIQGLAGGGLQPGGQGVLLDTFPQEKQGAAMTFFGFAALIAPVLGPTLGGWITDNYSWRWTFFINVPVGVVSLAACYALLRRPRLPESPIRRIEKTAASVRLSRSWSSSHYHGLLGSDAQQGTGVGLAGRPLLAGANAVNPFFAGPGKPDPLGVASLETCCKFPAVGRANFLVSCIVIFSAYAVLYGASTTLPALLQSLFGYDALNAGLVMSPAGVFAVIVMPVVAFLLGRGKDARWIIMAGLLVMGAGNYWMSQMNLNVSPGLVVWPRVVTIMGLSMCFAPLNVAAYLYTPTELRGAAVGLLSLLRNEGGSVGTSLAQTLHERLFQFHTLRLGEYLDPFNPAVHSFLHQVQRFFLGQTGDPELSKQVSWQSLGALRLQQASSLAYFDCFWIFAVIALALVPLVFFMKRSVAEKGVRVGAE